MSIFPQIETTLFISHHIFLTKEQRYALVKNVDIEVIGISVPVWQMKEVTSEPASEVFCKYILLNRRDKPHIKFNPDGYEISLPLNNAYNKTATDFSTEEESSMPVLKDLLDVKDGGCAWMAFKQNSKINLKNNKDLLVCHFVQIKDKEEMEKSLTFV